MPVPAVSCRRTRLNRRAKVWTRPGCSDEAVAAAEISQDIAQESDSAALRDAAAGTRRTVAAATLTQAGPPFHSPGGGIVMAAVHADCRGLAQRAGRTLPAAESVA